MKILKLSSLVIKHRVYMCHIRNEVPCAVNLGSQSRVCPWYQVSFSTLLYLSETSK